MCYYMHVLSSPTEIITGGGGGGGGGATSGVVNSSTVCVIRYIAYVRFYLARALIMLVREIQTRKQLGPAIDTYLCSVH